MLRSFIVCTLTILAAPFLAAPGFALENETLLVAMPKGYKPDYQAKNAREMITEMVPQNETVHNWTEMVTVQIFYNARLGVDAARDRIAQGWVKTCTDATAHKITQGNENNYPFAVWMLSCPRNDETGKPEWTWFKAIQGNDSLYVVQKAFKFEPAQAQVIEWTRYLKSVSVCDTRGREHPCPSGVK
jgi:hypothetical protein